MAPQPTSILTLSSYVLTTALREPSKLGRFARKAGAGVLDARFLECSPISSLPENLSSLIGGNDVILPPPSLLERGNQDLPGMVFLASIAKSLRAERILEIGTYNGLTAYCLAQNMPGATIYTLDLPPDQPAALPLDVGDSLHIRDYPKRVYERLPHGGKIEQLLGDSATFDFSPFVGKCDLVYVDGAHSREYVLSDTQVARSLLTRKAAIVWDDYRRGMSGVVAALDSVSQSLPMYLIPGTRLVTHFTDDFLSELETQGA